MKELKQPNTIGHKMSLPGVQKLTRAMLRTPDPLPKTLSSEVKCDCNTVNGELAIRCLCINGRSLGGGNSKTQNSTSQQPRTTARPNSARTPRNINDPKMSRIYSATYLGVVCFPLDSDTIPEKSKYISPIACQKAASPRVNTPGRKTRAAFPKK